MEIIKTKGLQDKYLWKDQRTKLIDLAPKLKRLPRSGNFKRVFRRTCPIYGRRLIPFPDHLLPKEFVGDIVINSKDIVESVLIKYVVDGERIIPAYEWGEEMRSIRRGLNNPQNVDVAELKRRMQEMRMISANSPDEE